MKSCSRSALTISTTPTQLLTELDGAAPADLTSEAADALTRAGKRALNREQYKSARASSRARSSSSPRYGRRYYAAARCGGWAT